MADVSDFMHVGDRFYRDATNILDGSNNTSLNSFSLDWSTAQIYNHMRANVFGEVVTYNKVESLCSIIYARSNVYIILSDTFRVRKTHSFVYLHDQAFEQVSFKSRTLINFSII